MRSIRRLIVHAVLTVAVLGSSSTVFAAPLSGRQVSQEVQDVQVLNFPATQNVKGSVAVDGVVSHSKSVKREGVLVPTSSRDNLNELINAGVLETDGFTAITLSMQGEVKSTNFAPGTVGVLLIPDEVPILRTLRERKIIQFPIECTATIKAGDPENFSAPQCHERLSFPRYRVFFYSAMNATVEANLYLQLAN